MIGCEGPIIDDIIDIVKESIRETQNINMLDFCLSNHDYLFVEFGIKRRLKKKDY